MPDPQWCQTWLLVNLAMQLLCLKFVTLALALRLNFAWASQFAWSVLLIWVGGVVASLITWVFVLYTPRKCMSFRFSFTAGLLIYRPSEQGFTTRKGLTFVLCLSQKCGNFMSALRLNTLSFSLFSSQNFSTLPGVSLTLL